MQAPVSPALLPRRITASRPPWPAIRRRAFLPLIAVLLILVLPSDGFLGDDRATMAMVEAIGPHGFRLATWEVQALAQKAGDFLRQPGAGLSPQAQHDLVIAYFDGIRRAGTLSGQVERIYADPAVSDPKRAAAALQAELDGLRAQQAARRPAVELILASQITAVLRDAGLGDSGRIFPPVAFQFTESPDHLVVSPRDRIAVERELYLDPALSVAQMEKMERLVEDRLDVSALVEGTGGFSTYPTMIVEIPSLEWVLSTVAHEWMHTYLVFRPLGLHYYHNGDTRTLNETTADIVGQEVGQMALQRFYAELVPPPAAADSSAPARKAVAVQKPDFDFSTFMRDTRLRTDGLLAGGKISEAESYMEAQRQLLISHGYYIRKLNQAYFALHSFYAAGPEATNPIGEKLHRLRTKAGSLAAFVRTVSRITSIAELDAALTGS